MEIGWRVSFGLSRFRADRRDRMQHSSPNFGRIRLHKFRSVKSIKLLFDRIGKRSRFCKKIGYVLDKKVWFERFCAVFIKA
jgi:hypothetical protein